MPEIAERESFRYTETEKEAFVLSYMEHGKLSEACRQTGYGYESAKALSKTEWFQQRVAHLRSERDRQLDNRYSEILQLGTEAMLDRIKNGEERITKSGDVVVMKPNLAAVTMAMGVTYDKRERLRGEGGVATETTALEKIAESLRRLVPEKRVIEAETVEFTDRPGPPVGGGVQ